MAARARRTPTPNLTAFRKTVRALRAAQKLGDEDEATVVLGETLARKLDTEDAYRRALEADALDNGLPVPRPDTTTQRDYTVILRQLGATPASRLEKAKGGTPGAGTLGRLRLAGTGSE